MKTSWDVTIWVGEDVNIVHTTTGGIHTITISGDETGRVAVQFLDGLDGLVAFRDEISRVVGAWVPPMPEEDLALPMGDETAKPPCRACGSQDGRSHYMTITYEDCSVCGAFAIPF